MRNGGESELCAVPRWSLWLVALTCFGPSMLMWLMGVLLLPIWVALMAAQLAQPERLANDSATIWQVAFPVGCVLGGLVGLIGLVRVLTLSRRERPKSHRVFTIGMVAVGLAAVVAFNWPIDFEGGIDVPTILFVLLPFAGTLWLLFASRKFLLAFAHRSDAELP